MPMDTDYRTKLESAFIGPIREFASRGEARRQMIAWCQNQDGTIKRQSVERWLRPGEAVPSLGNALMLRAAFEALASTKTKTKTGSIPKTKALRK